MNKILTSTKKIFSSSKKWKNVPVALLPFADAASFEMPFSKLLKLSLFQVSVGIGIVLLAIIIDRISLAWTKKQREALGL